MISIHIILWVLILLFAVIGSARGWAKELLVTFSVILGLCCLNVLETYVTSFKDVMATSSVQSAFWIRTGIVSGLALLGYEAPKLQRLAASGRFERHLIQDSILGGIFGAVNGFLLFGTIWFFLNQAGYPFPFSTAPDVATESGLAALSWIKFLPPSWLLGNPAIYFAVAICFVCVLVVFIL